MNWISTRCVAPLMIALTLAGCGGGGGSVGGGASGRSAALEAGKAYYSYAQLGPVADTGRAQGETQALGSISSFVKKVVRHPENYGTGRGGWIYSPEFDLYYQVTIDTPTRIRMEFRENENGTGGSGYLDIRLIDDEPYPVAVTVDIGLAAGTYRMSGSLRLDVVDVNWNDVRLRGQFSSSRPSTAVSFDLREQYGTVTGWYEASDSQDRVRLNNVFYNGTTFSANIVSGSFTGFLSVNSNGSGYCTVVSVEGTSRLDWNSSYYATYTAPGGSPVAVGYLWELQ